MQIKPYWQNYINGEFVDAANRLKIENPADGSDLAEIAQASAGDIGRAVDAARACHESGVLTDMRPVELGRMVRGIGDWILDHKDRIAEVLTLEAGKPYWESLIEVEGAARYFEYYGNQAETVEGRSIPLGKGYLDFTVYEPMGVSAQIIPWNFPLEMVGRGVATALATGNTCVVKTPELDPLSSVFFAEAADAVGLPKGALNILCGLGHEAGAALASHPDINQIVFTGSVKTGISVATAAAQNVVPAVLELGGKSAAIVMPDADLDNLADSIRWGIYFNAGQVCSAMSRVIVHRSIHDEVVERAVAVAKEMAISPGIDLREGGMTMGAMVSDPQRDRAEGMCRDAVAEGATLATGGHRLNREGSFHEATVVTGVTPDMTIAREAVFGPVLSVLAVDSDDEAIAVANSTEYGLVGGVFTADLDRATRAARRIRAGQVFVNEWFAGGVETPFGGYGKSGYGREKGREALMNYVQTKNIAIRMS